MFVDSTINHEATAWFQKKESSASIIKFDYKIDGTISYCVGEKEVSFTCQALLPNVPKHILPFPTKMDYSKFIQNLSNPFNNVNLGDGQGDNNLFTKVCCNAWIKKHLKKTNSVKASANTNDN